jgi:ABC-type Fe3+/spermidine/putrescine transport system ATPase subunit
MSLELVHMKRSFPEFDIAISLTVKDGELLTLLGPSGCGKTTTLNLVAGFLVPDSGRIILHGEDVTTRPPYERRMGVVFQDYSLFPNLEVFGNVAFGLRMHGWRRDRILARVDELLDLVHLRGYERRGTHELSGGEQQRVALARALAPRPDLLLLDEPLSALDAKLRTELRGEIRRIQGELGVTTLYVTHDQEEAFSISDRVAVMNRGTIEQVGTPRQIYGGPRTVFTAGFTGIRNRIEGKVTGQDGAYIDIDTPCGLFRALRGSREDDRTELAPGSSVVIMFRAGRVRVSKKDAEEKTPPRTEGAHEGESRHAGNANIIRGRVVRVEFQGEHTNIEVESGKTRLYARCPADHAQGNGLAGDTPPCDTGDTLELSIQPRHVLVFPSQG